MMTRQTLYRPCRKQIGFNTPCISMKWAAVIVFILLVSGMMGCIHQGASQPTVQPSDRRISLLQKQPVVKNISNWNGPENCPEDFPDGLTIITSHYRIHTTLTDPLILKRVPVFLESCWRAYTELTEPARLAPAGHLTVYLFNTREEWETFTRQHTSPYADTYLKIRAGAYYTKGACVAWQLSRQSSFSILAHEGWHQFSDRYLTYRLPAWLDEGLATSFEAFQWQNGGVRFVPAANAGRLYALRDAVNTNQLFSIDQLLALDAGRVLSDSGHDTTNGNQVDTYYAQVYALIRFLREYNYFQYYQNLRRIIYDAHNGDWPLSESDREQARQLGPAPTRDWNARVGKLIFNHYLPTDQHNLYSQYVAFCQSLIAHLPQEQNQ